MTFPHPTLGRRTALVLAAATTVTVGFGGWAFADGSIPLVSSPAASTSPQSSNAAANGATTPANVAGAVNTGDGKTVIAISLKIVKTDSSTVDPTNAAIAVASCTDCQTVAIALEGVLVAGSPTTFDPTNIALAINSNCTNCQTLATAYQDVVQHDGRVRISGAGRQEIAAIRKDLESIRNSGLDIAAIQQRVNTDAGRFLAVLQSQVIPIGRPSATGAAPATPPSSTAAVPSSTTTTTTASTPTSTSTTAPTAATTTTVP